MPRVNLHPVLLLLGLIVFALAIPQFNITSMLVASTLVVVIVLFSDYKRCWRLMRRTRVLLIMLLGVYSFTTPGTPLFSGWEQASPTVEGLNAGLQQIWRLGLMIGGVAAMISYLSRNQLLGGLYYLLLPLKPIGIPVERFALRLWLTLHYVETLPKMSKLGAHWENAITMPKKFDQRIQIEIAQFHITDIVFAVVCIALLGWALL